MYLLYNFYTVFFTVVLNEALIVHSYTTSNHGVINEQKVGKKLANN